MKKIFLLFICMILFSSLYVNAAEGETVVINENFQNYRTGDIPKDNWTYSQNDKAHNNYMEVALDPEDDNNKVLKIYADGNAGIIWAYCDFKPIGGTVHIDYKFYLSNHPNNVQYIGHMAGIVMIMTYQGAYVFGSESAPNISPTPEKWHTMHLDLDFSEKKFNAYIDGDLVKQNMAFGDPDLESIERIPFGSANDYLLIDDMYVSYEGGIIKNYTKLSTDNYHYNSNLKGIYNVPVDETAEKFLKKVNFVEGSKRNVYESDGETLWTKRFLDDTAILRVQSPDLTQDISININIRPWVASVATVNLSYDCITAYNGGSDLLINNKLTYIDSENKEIKSFIKDGEFFVPLRAICEGFGIEVGYNSDEQKAVVNGKLVDSKCENILGRMFLSAENLADLIDKKVLVNERGIVVFSDKDVILDNRHHTNFVNELLKRMEGE